MTDDFLKLCDKQDIGLILHWSYLSYWDTISSTTSRRLTNKAGVF